MSDNRFPTAPALIGLGVALAVFYWGDRLPLAPVPQLLALVVFAELALLRPELALLFVPATAPLYLIPAAIPGLRAEPLRLPLHEVALLTVLAVTSGRWVFTRWRATRTTQRAEQPVIPVPTELFQAATLRRYAPHLLLLIAGVIGVLIAVPEGRSAALREFRWLIAEPLLFYALLRAQLATNAWLRPWPVWALVASATVVATIGLLQFVGLDLAPLFGEKQNFGGANVVDVAGLQRVTSVYGHPNNLGLFLGRAWPLAAALALFGARTGDQSQPFAGGRWSVVGGRSALVPGLCALVCLAGIAVSFSRGAWLGAVAAAGVLAIVLTWKQAPRTTGAFAPGAWWKQPALVFGLPALVLLAVMALLLRGGLGGGSADARVLLWREALALIRAHPLGLGLDQFYFYHNPEFGRSIIDPSLVGTSEQFASHPHNLVLDAWLNVGPLGLAALAWLVARFVRHGIRTLRQAGTPTHAVIALGALAAMAAGLTHGMVDVFFFVPDLALVFWLLLALVEGSVSAEPRSAE